MYSRELNYHDADAVNARLQGIRDMYANLSELSQQRADRIQVRKLIVSLPLHMSHNTQTAIENQQRIDQLRLEFAKRAAVSVLTLFLQYHHVPALL